MANNEMKELAKKVTDLEKTVVGQKSEIEKLQALIDAPENELLKKLQTLEADNVKIESENESISAAKDKLSQQVADLQKQIKELQSGKPAVNISGFMLDVGDPFGLGTIADYRKFGGASGQSDRLPFVLPEKEEASKKALKLYIVRASAASDTVRVKAAQKAIK
jgi:hypothetical protein